MPELSSIIIPEPKILTGCATNVDAYIDRVLLECSQYKPIKHYMVYKDADFFKLKEEVDAKIEKEPSFEVAGIKKISGISKDEYVAVLVDYQE